MKLSLLIVLALALIGCHENQQQNKTTAQQRCDRVREGKLEERQLIEETCFYRGAFKKSTSKGW